MLVHCFYPRYIPRTLRYITVFLPLRSSTSSAALGEAWVRRLLLACGCLSALALGPAGEEAVVAAVSHHVEARLRRLALGVYDREVRQARV